MKNELVLPSAFWFKGSDERYGAGLINQNALIRSDNRANTESACATTGKVEEDATVYGCIPVTLKRMGS